MSQDQLEILKHSLEREKQARIAAEKALKEKSEELFETSQKLQGLLNETTAQLQGVFENIADAYVIMDINGNILKSNEAATKLFGYDIEKSSITVFDLIYQEDIEHAKSYFKRLQEKGVFKDFETRIFTKNKDVKWVHINGSIIFDEEGIGIAAQGIVRDITEEKESAEQLIKSESRLSSLITNLDSGILLEDENRKIVLTNKKFCDLFSIPVAPELLIGQDCSDAANQSKIHFVDEDGFVTRINELLKNKKTVLGDELIRKNGVTLARDFVPVVRDDIYRGHLWTYRDITLSRTYRKRLEAQKQKYGSIIANMNLGLVEVNKDDEIMMINQSFAEMSGYNEEELIGKKGGEVFQAEKTSNIIEVENKKRLEGESNSYELKAKKKSGEIRHWLISGAPNYDINGEVIGSIGVHLDITENKLNTELIEQQKQELDVIVDNSPVGIVLTRSGQIIKTNKVFQSLLGFSEEELSTLTIKDLSLKEDYPKSKANLDKLKSGEINNFSINKRYRKKDGSVIWAKTSASVVRNNDGEIKYQIALIEDVTLERERIMIIDMINNLTKSILGKTDINDIAWETVNNIADYLDSKDCIIYLVDNEDNTLEKLAVYGEKVNDKGLHKRLKLPIIKGTVISDVIKTAKSEIIKDTCADGRNTIDHRKKCSEIVVPIINNGKVIGIIDSVNNQKSYYAKSHIDALESIASLVAIKLRTALNLRELKRAEINNRSLLTKLERSNDELQEYAHVVSHDLKSPLRSINALVSWIKEDNEGKLDDNSLKNFDLIGSTLEKMEQLITDILTYSSIGSEEPKTQKVDLDIVVDNLREILFIPDHIKLKVKSKLPVISGEEAKFQQLFQNLISNAVKFNDKKEGLIEIDVEDKKSFYQFSVKDNGIGIEKKYHKKIFEIFHSLKKNNKESTGIGLSIVKKIVNLYQGDIWLESELNVYATFFFTLKK